MWGGGVDGEMEKGCGNEGEMEEMGGGGGQDIEKAK